MMLRFNKATHLPLRKNIFACLFSVHNRISLSRANSKYINILVHGMMNLLYYKLLTFFEFQEIDKLNEAALYYSFELFWRC